MNETEQSIDKLRQALSWMKKEGESFSMAVRTFSIRGRDIQNVLYELDRDKFFENYEGEC